MSENEKKEEPVGLKLSPELMKLLAKLQEVELEDFEMDVGDLEIWIQPGAVAPRVAPPMKVSPQP